MSVVSPSSSAATGSSVSNTARTFDVGKEAEVLQLLNFIRRGPFETINKNDLRDAVLDFSVNKDPTGLQQFSALFANNGVTLTRNGESFIGSVSASTASQVTSYDQSGTPPTEPVSQTIAASNTNSPSPAATADQETIPQSTASPAPVLTGFGNARPQPSFGSSQPTPAAPVSEPAPETSAPIPPKDPEVNKVPIRSAITDPAPAPSAEPISMPIPTPEPPSTSPAEFTTPTTASSVSKETTVPSTSKETTAASAIKDPLERVKEIKRLVNEKVGNPVNLIDANNTVGREYMNALLNAMKRVNGGSDDEIKLAMERLEKAYTSVKDSIESGETVIGVSDKTDTREATESNQDQKEETAAAPEESNPEPQTPGFAAASESPTGEPVDQPAVSEANQTAPAESAIPAAPAAASLNSAIPSVPSAAPSPALDQVIEPPVPTAAPTPPVAPPISEPTVPESAAPTPSKQIADTTPLSDQPAVATTPAPTQEAVGAPVSLASKLQAESEARAKLTAEKAVELKVEEEKQSADPLHSNEVSAGLQQLLSEWKLFKSSGIFGTGPSGYEHPLYKTLSALPMSAVIAGRFDGATPEIKQSITDYMNGWRYEQNVVHEMNETFERYLRRVIKSILEKQKQTKA